MNNKIILSLILILALSLRVIDISTFTPGVYLDEASMAYDAYSLGLSGTDQFGKSWPIYLRSFAMYQAPLYTYLSIIPVKLLGVNPMGIRLVSLISGMLTILLVYLLLKLVIPSLGEKLGLLNAFVLSISPWHILFSRNALEANLGLFLFVLSIYLFFLGLCKKRKLAVFVGLLALATTNYAYHSYRVTSVIIALVFPILFWSKMGWEIKKVYVAGLIVFSLILIPQLMIINSAGSLRRYQLLEYTSEKYFNANGDWFKDVPAGRYLFIARDFLSKYFDFLSPKSIFFEEDPAATKSISELSSFYSWMFIFYCLGLIAIIRKYHNKVVLFFILVGLLSLIPSAVTTDNLYLLRALNYLLVVSFIISLGLMETSTLIKIRFLTPILFVILLVFSLINFNINYFHISKNERKSDYSGFYNELFEFTKLNKEKQFIIDVDQSFIYSIALYVYQYDPEKFQKSVNMDLGNYYDDTTIPKSFEIDNLKIRKIDWVKDVTIDQYIVGDEITASEELTKLYKVTLVKKLKGDLDKHQILIYKTNVNKQ